ncbi:MAG: hypothetical protein R3Y66_00290 [Rikenellaceae bacterium]
MAIIVFHYLSSVKYTGLINDVGILKQVQDDEIFNFVSQKGLSAKINPSKDTPSTNFKT